MAEINSQNAWSKFKTLAQQVMGTKDISDADLKKLMKDSDSNGDGLFSIDEFKETLSSYDEYMDLEEEFLEVFDAIAMGDGENTSISEDDIESAINGAEEVAENATGDSPSGSGPSNGPSGGPKQDPAKDTNQQESISRSDIEGKDVNTLQNEKGSLLNDISSVRDEKTNAIAESKQKTDASQQEYDTATQAFDELIKTQEETDEAAQQASDKVQELNTQKSDKNSEISTQEGVVSEANTLVSTISSSLSSLEEPPQYISETVTNADGTTSTIQKENPAYQTYLNQKAALEEQLAAAEEDLANQEELLASLEVELTNIEKNHQQAVDNYCKVKEELGQLTPELANAQKTIQDKKLEYNKAQSEEAKVASQYDKQIETLRNNLGVYSDVIKEKELNVPEGYSVVNGQIVGGEGDDKHTLTLSSEQELPEGAKIDENNIIKDADGKEIGRVFGADSENPQVYIKEPAPLDPQLIDICVDMLLNGHELNDNPATAEEVWTDINGNGLELGEINSTDLAKIRDAYNQRVELNNSHETEEKLKTFDEMAEEMLKDSKPEVYEHVKGAGEKADAIDAQEQTFSEYIKENGVDVATTSQVVLDKYLNDYVKEQTGSEAKYELSDEKIDEVVSAMINGAEKNGEQIPASELLKDYDFDSVSSESVAKIIQQYNEQSETSFTENIDNFELEPEEITHITDSLVKSLNSNDKNLQNSSSEVLNELIDKSLSENDSSIIDTIIKSADANLSQVQKLINDGDLMNKIDTSSLEDSLKAELKESISHIKELKAKSDVFSENNGFELVKGEGDTDMSYSIIKPKNLDPNEEAPVMIYLHGAGGSERSLYSQVMDDYGLAEGFNGYIICPTAQGNWDNASSAQNIDQILNTFGETHKIDPNNIVVVGHSMGGTGALYMADSEVFKDDEGYKISKAAAITGYAETKKDYDIPVALYADSTSEYALKDHNLNADSNDKYVDWVGEQHTNMDNRAFTEDADGDGKADLLEWLYDED